MIKNGSGSVNEREWDTKMVGGSMKGIGKSESGKGIGNEIPIHIFFTNDTFVQINHRPTPAAVLSDLNPLPWIIDRDLHLRIHIATLLILPNLTHTLKTQRSHIITITSVHITTMSFITIILTRWQEALVYPPLVPMLLARLIVPA